MFGARLDSDASEKLAAAMRAAPGRFVAQRRVMPSTVPVIEGDELKPRSLVLRAFVVADGVDGYETMPGALAVVGGAADEIDISIARGARSKDTWVISDGEVSEFSLLRPAGAAGGADPRRRRSAQPRRRQLLLAGPLRRARRGDRAPGAR